VLASQYAAIAVIRAGAHWNEAHEATMAVITAGLLELGLLTGTIAQLIENESYKEFFMHKTGHWLGLDVHDVGSYKLGGQWRVLEVGMVLTVEPGIYISPTNMAVAAKWRGIGVRIEDDIVVTKDGCEVLSKDVPKDADEIEALMRGGQSRLF
jgi:Xaa-Pro aminopeptidase